MCRQPMATAGSSDTLLSDQPMVSAETFMFSGGIKLTPQETGRQALVVGMPPLCHGSV